MRVIPTDVLDKEGNLEKIEFYDELGGFQFQAMWDPTDEQTADNAESLGSGPKEWPTTWGMRWLNEVGRGRWQEV